MCNIKKYYGEMFDVLIKPEKTFKTLQKRSLLDGVLAVVFGALVPAVVVALVAVLAGSLFGLIPIAGPLVTNLSGAFALFSIITIPIAALIAFAVGGIYNWIIAKLVGGKGAPEKFLSVYGFFFGAVTLVGWILFSIPFVNVLFALYALYLFYKMLQPTMKMTSDKAVLTIIVSVIVALVLSWLFGFKLMGII